MRRVQLTLTWVALAVAFGASRFYGEDNAKATTEAVGSVTLARVAPADDPCETGAISANPTRPAWDFAATNTQCGVMEADSGLLIQPMGKGAHQTMWMSSMRYGVTPKFDLRWGVTNHMTQSGGGPSLEGIGDEWLMARYRFLEQCRFVPALAFLYGYKVPMANPAKGFGSGFADSQFVLIASRDLGKNHFDFNVVGTEVGEAHGHDGAAQFGLALTRPVTKKLSGILESYGGPQPGTSDRFGAAFTGVSYTLRPSLVIDGAYSRTYTAGTPRQQVLFGMTHALRPGFSPISRASSIARLLGR